MNKYKMVTIDGKFISYHRHLVQLFLGRKLLRTEHVHHINGDKSDNRLENLVLLTSAEHTRLHHRNKHVSEETRSKISKAKKGKKIGKMSKRHRKNISIALTGKSKTWLIGIKPSEKNRLAVIRANTGKIISEKTRARMRIAAKKREQKKRLVRNNYLN